MKKSEMPPYLMSFLAVVVIVACFVVNETAGMPDNMSEYIGYIFTEPLTTSSGGQQGIQAGVPASINDIVTTPAAPRSDGYTTTTATEPYSDGNGVTPPAAPATDDDTLSTPSSPSTDGADTAFPDSTAETLPETSSLTSPMTSSETLSNEVVTRVPIETTTDSSSEAETLSSNETAAELRINDTVDFESAKGMMNTAAASENETSPVTSKVEPETVNASSTDNEESGEEKGENSMENASIEKTADISEDYDISIIGKPNESYMNKNSHFQLSKRCTRARDLCIKREDSPTTCQKSYDRCKTGEDKTEESDMNKRFLLDVMSNITGPLGTVVGSTLNGLQSTMDSVTGGVTNLVESLTGSDKKCPFQTNVAPQGNPGSQILLVDKEASGQNTCPPPVGVAPTVTQTSPMPLKCPFTNEEPVQVSPPLIKMPAQEELKPAVSNCDCMQEIIDKLLPGLREAIITGLDDALGHLTHALSKNVTEIVKPVVDALSSVTYLTQGLLGNLPLSGIPKILENMSGLTKSNENVLPNAVAPVTNLASSVASQLNGLLSDSLSTLGKSDLPLINTLSVNPIGDNPLSQAQSKVADAVSNLVSLLPVPVTNNVPFSVISNPLQTASSIASIAPLLTHIPDAAGYVLSANPASGVNAALVASSPLTNTANVPIADTVGSAVPTNPANTALSMIPAGSANVVNAASTNSAAPVSLPAPSGSALVTNPVASGSALATNPTASGSALATNPVVSGSALPTNPATAVYTAESVPSAQVNTILSPSPNLLGLLFGKRR